MIGGLTLIFFFFWYRGYISKHDPQINDHFQDQITGESSQFKILSNHTLTCELRKTSGRSQTRDVFFS